MARTTIRTEDITASEVTTAKMAVDPTNADNLASGSVPAARLGNVPPDTGLQNDIATLALHSAIADNKAAFNLTNAFVDQFEDSSGVDTTSSVSRNADEYMSSTQYSGQTVTIGGNATYSTTDKKFGSGSLYLDGTTGTGISIPDTNITTGDFTVECWYKQTARTGTDWIFALGDSAHPPGIAVGQSNSTWMQIYGNSGPDSYEYTSWSTESSTTWKHIAIVRDNSLGTYPIRGYDDGIYRFTATSSYVRTIEDRLMIGFRNGAAGSGSDQDFFTGYIDEFRLSDNVRYSGASDFTVPTAPFTPDANTKALFHMDGAALLDESTESVSASGNFTSTTQTANATVSKMGIVVLYKNQAGTATLDTDLVVQVSADGGSNYVSAPLTSAGTFSTGILSAKSNDITISNTGTAPKYKISFANQSAGVKETQVHGVALLY